MGGKLASESVDLRRRFICGMSTLRYSYITINSVIYAGHLMLIGERKMEITVG